MCATLLGVDCVRFGDPLSKSEGLRSVLLLDLRPRQSEGSVFLLLFGRLQLAPKSEDLANQLLMAVARRPPLAVRLANCIDL